MKISRTAKDDIPKYSAMPPHTPVTARSVEDLVNFRFNAITPNFNKIIILLNLYE